MAINAQKVVVGGLAAGVVIFVLDLVSQLLLLGDRFKAAMDALNPSLSANAESTGAMVGFAIMDILFGVVIVWLYAAIRPRFGPGPRTATIAGVYYWLLSSMVWVGLVLMGMFGWDLFAIGAAIWLVVSIAGANVGAWLYTE